MSRPHTTKPLLLLSCRRSIRQSWRSSSESSPARTAYGITSHSSLNCSHSHKPEAPGGLESLKADIKDRRDMATKRSASFDTKTFLTKVGKGRSIVKCRKDEIVFSQGDTADAVFYVQKGRV